MCYVSDIVCLGVWNSKKWNTYIVLPIKFPQLVVLHLFISAYIFIQIYV